jgi:DNA adenine methylase
MSEAKIKAIAPWFGGKRTLAPAIVVELGQHAQYFEPFCGSLAVLLAKTQSRNETVNDLHGDVINLARVIQDPAAGPVLYDRLQTVLFSESFLRDASRHLDDESSLSLIVHHKDPTDPNAIERAYWFFIASWMMRNGVAGTQRLEYQAAVRWTKSGGSPTTRFRNAIESIPAWHERLRNVVILCRDGFMIMDRFEDSTETAIYADPPYLPASRSGYGNHGNGSKYKYEFEHEGQLFGDDHTRLASALGEYKHARIVVSYYDCPRVRELYRGWTFVSKTRHKHLHVQNSRGAGKKEAPEVLIINGPSYAKE